jgi:hypothetical protein
MVHPVKPMIVTTTPIIKSNQSFFYGVKTPALFKQLHDHHQKAQAYNSHTRSFSCFTTELRMWGRIFISSRFQNVRMIRDSPHPNKIQFVMSTTYLKMKLWNKCTHLLLTSQSSDMPLSCLHAIFQLYYCLTIYMNLSQTFTKSITYQP